MEMISWVNYLEPAILFIIGVIILRYWAIRNDYDDRIVYPVVICAVWFLVGLLLSYLLSAEGTIHSAEELMNINIVNSIISMLVALAVGVVLAFFLYRISPIEAVVMVGIAVLARFVFSVIWGNLIGFMIN